MALNSVTGEHYAKYSEPVRIWTRDIVTQYLPCPTKFQSVLDLGCGTGQNSVFIHELTNAKEFHGIDVNPNFLNHAKETAGYTGINYKTGDLNSPDWMPETYVGKFDLVFSSFTLHWVKDVKAILQQTKDVLAEGGESFHVIGVKPSEPFAITMKQMLFDDNWSDYLDDFKKAPGWQSKDKMSAWNLSADPATTFRKMLEEAGHEVLRCELVPVEYVTKSVDESKGMLEWLLPLTSFVPQVKMAEFMADAHKIYSKYCRMSEDGNTIWETSVLAVHTRVAPLSKLIL